MKFPYTIIESFEDVTKNFEAITSEQGCAARAYRSAALTLGTNVLTKVPVDTLSFPAAAPFYMDVVTNHRYNVPVTGVYQAMGEVNMAIGAAAISLFASIAQNGAEVSRGTEATMRGGVATDPWGAAVGDLLYCNAGDYLELYAFSSAAGSTLNLSVATNYLSIVRIS